MAETLDQVKRRFGSHAVILNTRSVDKSGLLGLGTKPYVEITAAPPTADLPEPRKPVTLKRRSTAKDCAEGAAKPMASSNQDDASNVSDALLSEVGALRALVGDLVRETRRDRAAELPDELHESYCRLAKGAVADDMVHRLLRDVRQSLSDDELRDPARVRTALARAVESMLPTAGPIRPVRIGAPTVIALVGATGVGKTTTVAKLAANMCLREHRRVGLITIDTYRIAAVEQLKTYARIIDIPLEVVMSPNQLKDAVARMGDRDVILIDTAGRSQRDTAKITELRAFFDVIKPDEVHLVLSSTCGESVLLETVQRFQPVGVNRVIFTKLDEALGFGVMLACLDKADAQLSYVTTGQDVPDDIEIGRGGALAELLLGERRTLRAVKEAVAGHQSPVTPHISRVSRPRAVSREPGIGRIPGAPCDH